MSIAWLAGPVWVQRVNELILSDVRQTEELDDSGDASRSPNLQLVTDLYQLFQEDNGFIATKLLVRKLINLNPEYWSSQSFYGRELNVQRLGRLLSSVYGIMSERVGDSPRGYFDWQFHTVWKQLGISPMESTEPTEPAGLMAPKG
jgi:hypothetical protein